MWTMPIILTVQRVRMAWNWPRYVINPCIFAECIYSRYQQMPSTSAMMSEDNSQSVGPSVGSSEPISPLLSIEELLASATDVDSSCTSYSLPEVQPVQVIIPPELLSRLQKSRYMISGLMKELAEVRRGLYELNDRLHWIDIVVQNTLRKMF
jgi:hypothetical protein